MGALLKLVFLAVIALLAFRFLQRALGLTGPARPGVEQPPQQVMRRCAYCQVHVPDGESTQSRGEFFCCEAHRDAFFREKR
jgi:uncharacterized protein